MGETAIQWADYTFNPWWGCTKVSPGCDHCYAEAWAKRTGWPNLWGAGVARRVFTERHWDQVLKWNEKAARDGVRRRVFCASMADVFDNDAPRADREWLWQIIEETEQLDWLLLTKRIGNAAQMLPPAWLKERRPNVWLGATVVNQEEADRDIPKLIAIPAAIRFLSCEPLLGPINLERPGPWSTWLQPCGYYCDHDQWGGGHRPDRSDIDWVIIGGESGSHARPFTLGWAKDIMRQCHAARVACFVKQVGSNPVNREGMRCAHIRDRNGGVMEEWPEELRVREFPR